MKKLPIVSVVIRLDRSHRFLDDAIRSICEQTYPKIEIVLADDGTTQGVTARAQQIAQQYQRPLRVEKAKTRTANGVSGSLWNLGAKRCRTEFIAFMEPDDVWLPAKVDEQVIVMQRHAQIAMVYGRTEIWQSWQQEDARQDDYFYDLGIAPERVYSPPTLVKLLITNPSQTSVLTSALFRRAAFQDVGGFDVEMGINLKEQIFLTQLHLRWPTYVANANWARHRTYRGRVGAGPHFSISNQFRRRRPFLEWLSAYLESTEYASDSELQALLQRELSEARHPIWAAFKRQTRRIAERKGYAG